MDQNSLPDSVDPVALLEQALNGHHALEKLEHALVLLDSAGADLAAAHVSRAIDALRDMFDLDVTRSNPEQALELMPSGS
ncbi:hypothetical protein [Novosphingobium sp.]|uniref:hypothetical protein n=1 Tax=Novosphingobium sp. TaxID=1874826 RepID=UPI00286E1C2C|nr:hypothetical protein [Novosphingobium sp.]